MNCGECLMRNVELVALRADGVCPRCGADYGAVVHQDAPRGPASKPCEVCGDYRHDARDCHAQAPR